MKSVLFVISVVYLSLPCVFPMSADSFVSCCVAGYGAMWVAADVSKRERS